LKSFHWPIDSVENYQAPVIYKQKLHRRQFECRFPVVVGTQDRGGSESCRVLCPWTCEAGLCRPAKLSSSLRGDCRLAPGAFEQGREVLVTLSPHGLPTRETPWWGVRAHLAGHEDQLRCSVAEQSDHTLANMWHRRGNGTAWSSACPCSRAHGKLWACRKKKTLTAVERNRPETEQARRGFQAKLSRVPCRDLAFVDERGVRTDLTRRYGRAPKG
jgi:hypothetical protein